jgi:hypothetical protein
MNVSTNNTESLAQEAFQFFATNEKLKIHINKGENSSGIVHRSKHPLFIDKKTIDHLLESATTPIDTSLYYFYNSERKIRYINQEVVDRFTQITKQVYPDLKFVRRFGLFDNKTNKLLMLVKADFSYASVENEVSVSVKPTAWVAKVLPSTDQS